MRAARYFYQFTVLVKAMRVAEMLHSSKIYGPGERTVLWLQGCSIQCENCWNDELWSFQGGQSIGNDEVITYAETHKNSGITLLEENLSTAPAVLKLIEDAQESGLDVLLYTGYELHELSSVQKQCVEQADIVIHGRYIHELRSLNLLWKINQSRDSYQQ